MAGRRLCRCWMTRTAPRPPEMCPTCRNPLSRPRRACAGDAAGSLFEKAAQNLRLLRLHEGLGGFHMRPHDGARVVGTAISQSGDKIRLVGQALVIKFAIG